MPVHRFHAPVVLPADAECSVIRDGVVDVQDDGRIGYCGPRAEAPPAAGGTPATKLSGILMPGLVNAHAHSAMTPLRGAGGDLPLISWLNDIIWPAEARMRPEDAHAGMLLGCVEMLQHGITTSAEMYMHGEAVVHAALTAGSRILLAPAYFDLPGAGWRSALAAIDKWIDEDGLIFGPGGRVELGYGPHSAYALPVEALRATAESAATRGALVHIHVAESLAEDREQRAAHGSVPRLLADVGLLDGRLLAAHAVHLSPRDIRLLADYGAGVAHCPGSNAKLASGIAALTALRAASVAVGLGTDGPASNDDLDLWEEMRLAMMLARATTADPLALTAKGALLLATRGGAAAVGRQDIGTLSPGTWADMIHVGVDGPHFAAGLDVPNEQLLANLVWAAGSRAVRDVWVAGEQVVADGEPLRVDRVAAQREVASASAHILRAEPQD
ncbi:MULTISPECIES: amidohydrolase family protein [unclassified Streptomyces]|uniref:amidohydrolase family protein n=1 Tax=unclassified Streptomyces TaxID=2593676 RepID=UPI0004C62202|nr:MULTISPECIES: amidohydrolase [unclassified Streptomyces]KOV74053.1 ethylammeline chlorohydrolase [Streptomyces sp. NRRL WC-3723]